MTIEDASKESNPDDGAPAASYAEATAEIDAILTELERDDLDVDLLATKVRRAAELLAWCRGRIAVATEDVQDAVDALATNQDQDQRSRRADDQAS